MSRAIIYTSIYHSPCGDIRLGEFDGRLCLCDWVNGMKAEATRKILARILKAEFHPKDSGENKATMTKSPITGRTTTTSPVLDLAAKELEEYFSGIRTSFDIPLLFVGTEFQKKVWNELAKIPYGTTISYGELACRIGHPSAVRAVANANARNPISILAPCHRVIGSDRRLTGYGGGLPAKKFLLELENEQI